MNQYKAGYLAGYKDGALDWGEVDSQPYEHEVVDLSMADFRVAINKIPEGTEEYEEGKRAAYERGRMSLLNPKIPSTLFIEEYQNGYKDAQVEKLEEQ